MLEPTKPGEEFDPNNELDLAWPGPKRILRLTGRVALLRCPYCGKGPVLKHWLQMREKCGNCGRKLERGEKDYFIGSMMFNMILSEGLFIAVLVTTLLLLPPPVPWDGLETWIPIGMIAAPFIMFPFSKLAWLAFDLIFRPDARRSAGS